jgi:two-component system cell cycle sensor histidine kinase/response regulator CckA
MIMPGMGGRESYNALKNINPNANILLSSGYSLDGEAMEIMERGCNGFLQKPFSPKQLSQKIREILDSEENPSKKTVGGVNDDHRSGD